MLESPRYCRGFDIPVEKALDHVFGYGVGDMTVTYAK